MATNLLTLVLESATEVISELNEYEVSLYDPISHDLIVTSFENPSFLNVANTGTWHVEIEMQPYTVAISKTIDIPRWEDRITSMENKFFATSDIKTHIADVTVAKTYHHTMAEIQTYLNGVMGAVPVTGIDTIDTFTKLIGQIETNQTDIPDLSAYSTTDQMNTAIAVIDDKVGNGITSDGKIITTGTNTNALIALDGALEGLYNTIGILRGDISNISLGNIYSKFKAQSFSSWTEYLFYGEDKYLPFEKDLTNTKLIVTFQAKDSYYATEPTLFYLFGGKVNDAGTALTTASVISDTKISTGTAWADYELVDNVANFDAGINVIGLDVRRYGGTTEIRNVNVRFE